MSFLSLPIAVPFVLMSLVVPICLYCPFCPSITSKDYALSGLSPTIIHRRAWSPTLLIPTLSELLNSFGVPLRGRIFYPELCTGLFKLNTYGVMPSVRKWQPQVLPLQGHRVIVSIVPHVPHCPSLSLLSPKIKPRLITSLPLLSFSASYPKSLSISLLLSFHIFQN